MNYVHRFLSANISMRQMITDFTEEVNKSREQVSCLESEPAQLMLKSRRSGAISQFTVLELLFPGFSIKILQLCHFLCIHGFIWPQQYCEVPMAYVSVLWLGNLRLKVVDCTKADSFKTCSVTGLQPRCSEFRCSVPFLCQKCVNKDFCLCSVFFNWEFLGHCMRTISRFYVLGSGLNALNLIQS